MIYPIKNWPTAKRGYRFGEKTFYSPHHLGVDHVIPIGTEIFAPCDCEIIYARSGVQGGKTIWISFVDSELGQLIIRFMHLDRMMAKGKYKEGEVIGYSGNTGKYTTGPHLHTDISLSKVKIKDFNNFIDPEKYFSKINLQNDMRTYKKIGEEKIYALVGNILIPFDVALETYEKEFGEMKVVILSEKEFGKYKIADGVRIGEVG